MKCQVIRTCFRGGSLYKSGEVREVSEEMAQKHPKDFLPIGQEPEPLPEAPKPVSSPVTTESNPLVCKVCGRECKSEFGLKAHMRVHKKG